MFSSKIVLSLNSSWSKGRTSGSSTSMTHVQTAYSLIIA